MIWIGLLAGIVVGGLTGGFPGAIGFGLIGLIVGIIANAQKNAGKVNRLDALEQEVAALHERIAKLEGRSEVVTPAKAGAQPTPKAPAPPAEPVIPAEAGTPSLLDRLLEGNIVAKLGVVILFFGVAFLLKLAYDRGYFPPSFRLAAVAAGAVAMLFLGWRLLASSRTYALILIGGAMGLLYLDVFFALKSFQFIGTTAAFGLFALLGIATLVLSVRLDARAIAVLGLLGGFLAPVLASSGQGQHVILFSYYLVLNLVILAVSWFRSWRSLDFVGFLFTFAIALLWGHANYRPELFATVEPFLIAFVALYLAIPILFATRQPPQLRGIVDGTLVFGMPLTAAMMQAALTRGMGDHVLAWSAAIMSAVYLVLAAALWRRERLRLLAEAHLALGVVFGTVAPYFAFSGYPTFAFWTLEAAAIFWVGARQGSVLARAFAIALQLGATGYFASITIGLTYAHPVFNERVVGCLLIAAAAFATGIFTGRFAPKLTSLERSLEPVWIAWSSLWVLIATQFAVDQGLVTQVDRIGTLLVVTAAMLAMAEFVGAMVGWATLRRMTWLTLPLLLVFALSMAATDGKPFVGWEGVAWFGTAALLAVAIYRQDRDGIAVRPDVQVVALYAVTTVLTIWAAHVYGVEARQYEFMRLTMPGLVIVFALSIATLGIERGYWPFAPHAAAFVPGIVVPGLVLQLLWSLVALGDDGHSSKLAYLPVVNLLDATQVLMLYAAHNALKVIPGHRREWLGLYGAAAFLWLNAVLLRTVHHWFDVPYTLHAMQASVVAQAGLSLLWTATALGLMFFATRKASRPAWMVGAALLGIVVVKLFVHDLSSIGTVARIVSFIGVGVFMLLIGYLAPVPPRATAQVAEDLSGLRSRP